MNKENYSKYGNLVTSRINKIYNFGILEHINTTNQLICLTRDMSIDAVRAKILLKLNQRGVVLCFQLNFQNLFYYTVICCLICFQMKKF